MLIGVPKEIKTNENRIALVPAGAEALTAAGHTVLIEAGAGLGSGFSDSTYEAVGATILGTVKTGEKLGRKLGYPTANLSAHSEQFPPDGVYVAEARLAGALYKGVANLGYRPTVSTAKPERLLELHLFDLNRDIYGEEIEVRFLRYLRPEQKFEDLEALTAQIAQDVAQAREALL